jgi:hypothetical protein
LLPARLAPSASGPCSCRRLPPDEFVALVRRIAEVTVKYEALGELRAARVPTPPDPRALSDDRSHSE